MIGTIILNYRVTSLLGSGGMGSVYLAEHLTLGRKAAIKVLLPELARNQQIRDRFINEARTLSLLSHQNIVTLYDFSDVDGNLVLVMEYTEGTPLDTVIEKITGAIPEQRCINIFRQVLDGFSYAHRKGVVHRDIKPANIILQSDDTPKILDFGIAKIVEGDVKLTKTGTRMGSVVYMSPEQVMGRDVDQRSDIYSLGVTLFEMLTGRLPYDTQTESEFDIQTKIVREPLPPIRSINPNVSETLESAIIKATEKDVNYRFQSCDEFSKALEQSGFNYTPQKTVYQQPQLYKTKIQQPLNYSQQPQIVSRKSNKPVLIFGGIALLIILLFVIYFIIQNGDTDIEKQVVTTNTQKPNTDEQNKHGDNKTNRENEKDKITFVIKSWLDCMENKDLDCYQSYITDDYQYESESAKNKFQSYSERSKILRGYFRDRSYISISVSNISVDFVSETEAKCSYDQVYDSDKYKDSGLKVLYMKYVNGNWKIYRDTFY